MLAHRCIFDHSPMNPNEPKESRLRDKLLHQYRMVILNEDSFEEKLSFRLTRLNVFILFITLSVSLIALTTVLIAFTPIKEFIPGYSSGAITQDAILLNRRADSLETQLALNEQYYASIKRVLTGDVAMDEVDLDSVRDAATLDPAQFDFDPSPQEEELRERVAAEDRFTVSNPVVSRNTIVFFPPVSGTISSTYKETKDHYGVDVTAPLGAPVKAVADGTVIFAGWTADTGYVILLEHSYGLISVYKHNSSLSKEQGQRVKAGEVIASVGDSGQDSTGPHLHFELWSDSYPVNPTDFINFSS